MLPALVRACRASLRASCDSTTAAISTGAAELQQRWASSADGPSEKELEIAQRLREQLPGARDIRVIDTSGGCGSMYQLHVTADEFRVHQNVETFGTTHVSAVGMCCNLVLQTAGRGLVFRRDLNIVKQHQLVARLLKEEIAQWHGFTLQDRRSTSTVESDKEAGSKD